MVQMSYILLKQLVNYALNETIKRVLVELKDYLDSVLNPEVSWHMMHHLGVKLGPVCEF